MKLDCNVVKDLYPLYMENELSNTVRLNVDNHLKECNSCKEIYDEGIKFNELITKEKEILPNKVDKKIKNKITIRRLQTLLIVITICFVFYWFGNYKQKRFNLSNDLNKLYHNLYQISHHIDYVKNDYPDININVFTRIEMLIAQNESITRQLNLIESRKLNNTENHLFFNYEFNYLLNVLHDRYINNLWSEKDEEVYTRVKRIFDDMFIYFESNNQKFHKSVLLSIIDLSILSGYYKELNELETCYLRYSKLPEEINLLSDEELESSIEKQLGLESVEIEIQDYQRKNITSHSWSYDCEVIAEASKNNILSDHHWRLTVDLVTGNILNISYSRFDNEFENLDKISQFEMDNKIKDVLKNLISSEFNYSIEYKGINYNYNSNIQWHKVYSYNVKAYYNSFEIDTRAYENIINFNVYTGQIHSIHSFLQPRYEFGNSDVVIPYDKCNELLSRNLSYNDVLEDYKYTKTVFRHTDLTNKYELFHVFRNVDNNREIFIRCN